LRPIPKFVDVFAHRGGQRHCLSQRVQNVFGRQLGPVREGVVQCADDGVLDFGPAEVKAGFAQRDQVELVWIASAFGEMNVENLTPLLGQGQVNKEHFVQQ